MVFRGFHSLLNFGGGTWRIIPDSKWLGSPTFIRHEVRPFGRGPTTLLRGLTITMVINHLLSGMILQVTLFPHDPFFTELHQRKTIISVKLSDVKWGEKFQTLGIQSPSENGFMEPKYYSEEVIGHSNHHLTR